jgi:hypothetical protein
VKGREKADDEGDRSGDIDYPVFALHSENYLEIENRLLLAAKLHETGGRRRMGGE